MTCRYSTEPQEIVDWDGDAEASRLEDDGEHPVCMECGCSVVTDDELEATPVCHSCAHHLLVNYAARIVASEKGRREEVELRVLEYRTRTQVEAETAERIAAWLLTSRSALYDVAVMESVVARMRSGEWRGGKVLTGEKVAEVIVDDPGAPIECGWCKGTGYLNGDPNEIQCDCGAAHGRDWSAAQAPVRTDHVSIMPDGSIEGSIGGVPIAGEVSYEIEPRTCAYCGKADCCEGCTQ